MIRAGILNVTGYVGAELVRLLSSHPEVQVTSVTGRSQAGQRLAEVYPQLWSVDLPIKEELDDVDVVLSALPAPAGAAALAQYVTAGTPAIDCGPSFRLRDQAAFENWYGKHPAAEFLENAVYGLPELHREAIQGAKLIAVPGCYATAAILALAPLAAAGSLGTGVIVDAKSGVSGAGRTLQLQSHFAEVDGSFSAYGLEGHRHQPEMVQELSVLAATSGETQHRPVTVTFVPHLLPITRGILATCYALAGKDENPSGRAPLVDQYDAFYEGHPFVEVAASPPSTKQTLGSNSCLVYPNVDVVTGQVTILACLDNLGKGAAGGAVQCMNLLLGFEEVAGLSRVGLYP